MNAENVNQWLDELFSHMDSFRVTASYNAMMFLDAYEEGDYETAQEYALEVEYFLDTISRMVRVARLRRLIGPIHYEISVAEALGNIQRARVWNRCLFRLYDTMMELTANIEI